MRARLALAALATLALAPQADAGVAVKAVDASAYPRVVLTVVTSRPSSRAPVVRENGARIAGTHAQNLARGKSIVLAIDRSRSMRGGALAHATAALRRFVAAKPAADRLSVIAFGSEAVALTRFSAARIDADIALRVITVDDRQGTTLYDAITLGSRSLATETTPARVLVVLTDGADTASEASRAEAIAAAREAGVAVYAIGIEGRQFAPRALRSIAHATGGRYFAASSSAAVDSAYAALAAELRRTWRVEYVTATRPGEPLALAVSVPGSGTARTRTTLPGEPEVSGGGSPLVPAALYSGGGTFLVALLVGGLAFFALGLLHAARRGSSLRGRLTPHVKTYATDTSSKRQRERLALAAEVFQATERSLGHLRLWRWLERLIERADVRLRAVELLYACVGAALFFGLLAALLGLPTILILMLMGIGAAAPLVVVSMKARKRLNAFEEQLPDLLLTIAGSLKAGHSFKQAIQSVVDDGQPPASKEFNRVVTEMQLGRPMDEALGDMAHRVGSPNFEFVMTAVTIQRQVGGSLSGLFDTVADTVRQRQQFARKIRGLTAMGRASAYVLVGLPFVLAGALTLLNREYMTPLYTTSSGHMLMVIGVISMTLGSLILRKIVSFKG